jgi:hypothetical protein
MESRPKKSVQDSSPVAYTSISEPLFHEGNPKTIVHIPTNRYLSKPLEAT